MAGKLKFKKEAVVVRTISGPGKHTSFSRGQELAKARAIVEKTINDGNETLIGYILAVAGLKSKGNDFFVKKIKKLSDKAIKAMRQVSAPIDKRVLRDRVRMINLHFFYNLDSSGAERFIEKFQS